ncbi:MAG TPA: hypothetical protein VGU23_06320 [Acidobacteriaceae bacterium]|nr:hypothetical protein [Acidobacteriaceae bacterium]
MRTIAFVFLIFLIAVQMRAADTCLTVHGRAHYYSGDGQLRIWHIGTHHDFEPDASSWDTVVGWLDAGAKAAGMPDTADRATTVDLFGDFLLCPTRPFKDGSVQPAKVISVAHRHYVVTQ